ncbi:MAG: Uncharacterised protein [Cryomorphaceae bacterium]|nr:MAG: Uncharacterised protein [Cryomorphaceae bacterium]
MICNRTYFDKEDEKKINEILGDSFSFLQTLKLRGVGSSRFIVHSVSESLSHTINKVSDINYCSIELRPSGIIVNITQQLNLFSWLIPYYKLVIFNSDTFSIHADGSNIKIVKDKNYLNNKNFISKMIKLKTKAIIVD